MTHSPIKQFAYTAIKLVSVFLFISGIKQISETVNSFQLLSGGITLPAILYSVIPAVFLIVVSIFTWISTEKIQGYFLPPEDDTESGESPLKEGKINGHFLSREDILSIGFSLAGITVLIFGIPLLALRIALFSNEPQWFVSAAFSLFYVIIGLLLLFGSNKVGRFFGISQGGTTRWKSESPEEPEST